MNLNGFVEEEAEISSANLDSEINTFETYQVPMNFLTETD